MRVRRRGEQGDMGEVEVGDIETKRETQKNSIRTGKDRERETSKVVETKGEAGTEWRTERERKTATKRGRQMYRE